MLIELMKWGLITMSMESAARIVELPKIGKHPNADTLSIVQVQGGYPCIFKSGSFAPGDRAVYIPVDSIVPEHPAFAFLEGHNRIKARRLRGIFSMGLLIPLKEFSLPEDIPVGEVVTELLGIKKYEPPIDSAYWGNNEQAADPGVAPVFDVEGLRMFPNAFKGKRVIVTEKIHGTNFRAVFKDGQLHIGSHRTWLKKSPCVWWNVAQNYKLEEKFVDTGLVFYGEIYGPKIQDLTYGVKTPQIVFYDVMRAESGQFLEQDDARFEVERLDLPFVPELYADWWDDCVKMLADGQSVLARQNDPAFAQIREGIVIRPTKEEFSPELGGRLILKICGEAYYTRKEK